ncbi:MAG: hypothetical protein AAB473_02890 [Patescibacteria group bacterium]
MDDDKIFRLLSVVAEATASTSIIVNGTAMAPLLPKTTEELAILWKQGRSAIAVRNGRIVGHASVEPLTNRWNELGVVWTDPGLREEGGPHRHVGLRLCSALLERHREKYILMTTVNPAMMVVGWRTGMVPIRYDQLPEAAWRATCCCPEDKTGVPRKENVPHCRLRLLGCFVQVTWETWNGMDRPEPCTLPVCAPTSAVTIPRDDINILLAE